MAQELKHMEKTGELLLGSSGHPLLPPAHEQECPSRPSCHIKQSGEQVDNEDKKDKKDMVFVSCPSL